MTKTAKRILIALLLIQNGYLVIRWVMDASQTNDVGRQWIRILIPAVMIIQSLATIVFVWIADLIVRKLRNKNIPNNRVP